MACACKKNTVRKTFVVKTADGKEKVVSSETEARAIVATRGGTYKVQG